MRLGIAAVGTLVVALTAPLWAVTPTQEELAQIRAWSKASFTPPDRSVQPAGGAKAESVAGLLVLANHDPVQINARAGKPLKIGDKQYTRGLYCHATSRIIVRLPGDGATFTATVGVDHNSDTSGGRGSIVFSVSANGKEAFRSNVMRGGQGGVPLKVDLASAREFVLQISDAGDGIACDQADWADAKATLKDGSEVWLADLPLIVSQVRERGKAVPPFSFIYDGRMSDELLGSWRFDRDETKGADGRIHRTLTYTDPRTGLEVRCVLVEYADFPTVEWTLHFRNTGKEDTPILEEIRSLDLRVARSGSSDFILHHFVGSPCTDHDYQPLETRLLPGKAKRISAAGGRPTNSDLPYFNIESGDGGIIAAVGWPGQWAADFACGTDGALRLAAGQELLRVRLRPGEEIRTPLSVLQAYRGDWIRAQNVWRRWMIACNLPRPGGKLPAPQMAACSSHQYGEMINANEANQKMFIDGYIERDLKLDYWWMDAGWYPNKHGWPHTGTWEVDRNRFPNGLRAISDYARAKGIKTLVWFEPERVAADTWLSNSRPEWVHGGTAGGLLKLGEPTVRQWLVEHVDKLLIEQGIDLYRQDFNMDPLEYWRANDAEDRLGMTEIRHVEGYLAYWDELRKRHPDMLIDSCASGGRRNDLETLRRAVPLLRSDHLLEPAGQQNHTYGIAFWMPFYGTGLNQFDDYSLRSMLCPHITACYDMRRRDQDFDPVRKMYRQWREQISPNYFGDYWPLTPYGRENSIWMAWQFDRPEAGQGVIQAFRRADCPEASIRLKLRGLRSDARYRLQDLDKGNAWEALGSNLMQEGVVVTLQEKPGSGVIVYSRAE